MKQDVIYLDNNATTAVDPRVRDVMLPFLTELYGNPSSIHTFGGQVKKYIDRARGQVAHLIGADPSEIIFTSCGTESDNTAILSALESKPRRRKVVTTRVEHPAVLGMAKTLQQRGYHVEYCPVNKHGQLCMDALVKMVTDDTAVVSVMWANNEIGNIYPVFEVAEIARQNGALFHTDAVQAVGKIPINLAKANVDFLSLSGHKLHGPKGVGALYVRKDVPFHPFMIGGHQEFGKRAGTENVASIVAFGRAAELAAETMAEERTRVARLRDRMEQGILKRLPQQAVVNGNPQNRLPNTSNISFKYVEGESILLHLNRFGIAASSGSACTSGSLEPSHVLRALGIPEITLHGSIRFSLSRYNTEEDIDFLLDKLPDIIHELRAISPYGRGEIAAS
ncbi:MAG: cysteine desulfurase NifS [Candidatus Pacebacteria bacterium]|nr:cysteine desulfurase NifS [Candidatus Paceibacterota bacterium]